MLLVTKHQGNSNKNHSKITSHICQDGYYFKKKKLKAPSVREDVEKLGSVHTISGSTNGTSMWDTVWRFLKM